MNSLLKNNLLVLRTFIMNYWLNESKPHSTNLQQFAYFKILIHFYKCEPIKLIREAFKICLIYKKF